MVEKESHFSSFPWWVKAILLLIALANLYRIVSKPPDVHHAVDFRNVYVGQLLLVEGENPYDDVLLKARWRSLAEEEGIEWKSEPGFPDNPLVYPPWALGMFSPLSWVSYTTGVWIWYMLIPVFLLVFLVGISSIVSPTYSRSTETPTISRSYKSGWGCNSAWDLLLLALAFKGTVHAFIVCQPTFLCFAAIGAFCWAYHRGKPMLAGFFLAIAAFKISLVIPFVLWMFFKKEWRVVCTAMGVGAFFWIIAMVFSQNPIVMHASWLETMGQLNGLVFDPSQPAYPIYFTMTQITELGTLMEYVAEGGSQWRGWIYLALWLSVIPFVGYQIFKKKMNDLTALVILCLLLFLTTYHQFYDLLLLLLLYPFAIGFSFRQKLFPLLIVLPLFLPVNGILNKLGLPEALWFMYFTTPLVVIALGIWVATLLPTLSSRST